MTTTTTHAQGEQEAVKATVIKFVKAADEQDAELVATMLNKRFRVVMNRLFGDTEVNEMERDAYVQLIKDKKMGGDKRSVEFISVEVAAQNASVHVKLKGKTMVFDSFIQLVKTADGKWQLVNDLPHATKI